MEEEILDLKEVLERVQDDRELLLELLDIFFEDYPKKIQEMRKSLRANNVSQVQDLAHSMKGASGNISAKKIYASFLTIEQMAKNNNLKAVEETLRVLDGQFAELQKHCSQLKEDFKSK